MKIIPGKRNLDLSTDPDEKKHATNQRVVVILLADFTKAFDMYDRGNLLMALITIGTSAGATAAAQRTRTRTTALALDFVWLWNLNPAPQSCPLLLCFVLYFFLLRYSEDNGIVTAPWVQRC